VISPERLRPELLREPNAYIDKFDYLTLDVERDLTKLLESEVKLH